MITRYELFISYQDIKIPEKQVKVKVSKNVLEITFLYFNTRKQNVKVKVSNNVFGDHFQYQGEKLLGCTFAENESFVILSHEKCIAMRNQSLHCDQKPKGKLFVCILLYLCISFVIFLYFFL